MSKKTPGITLLTPPGILSFPSLFEPRAPFPNQPPKYSASLIIPKSRAAELKPLMDAVRGIALAHFGPDFGKTAAGKVITVEELFASIKLHHPVKDGDVARPQDKAYAGQLFFQASTDLKHKPVVVDASGQPVMGPDEIYPGCLARMRIYVCPFEQQVKKGITLLLNGVQKLRDGARLDGRVTTFDAWEDDGTGAVEGDADPMA